MNNSAVIPLDRYLSFLETEKKLAEVTKLLADTIEPLAEYKNMCLFLQEDDTAMFLYEAYLCRKNVDQVPAKPSTDCLAANTKLTWGEVTKMAEEVKAEMAAE